MKARDQNHQFEKSTDTTPLDTLPKDIYDANISTMSDVKDTISLMQISKRHNLFFQEAALLKGINQLLSHVIYGEYKKAKVMVEQNPRLLLQKGTATVAHSALTFKEKTALQTALYLREPEMVELFQRHMDLEVIQTQQKAQLPEGYRAIRLEKIKEGCRILEETFKAIHEAKVGIDDQGNLIPDEQAALALKRLKKYLKPKDVETEVGQSIDGPLLLEAYELYDKYFDRFAIRIPEENLTYLTPKHMLAWQQIVGGIQRYRLSFSYFQAMSENLRVTYQKIKEGTLQGRTSIFETWNGNNWIKTPFLSMVSIIGMNGAIYGIKARFGVSKLRTLKADGACAFENLYKIKTSKLLELMEHPVHRKGPVAQKTLICCF